jgi:hypothetical protein
MYSRGFAAAAIRGLLARGPRPALLLLDDDAAVGEAPTGALLLPL